MADIFDILRALNAPPALGDYSAAKAQPYLNTGIGTGGGMQLVMKDPQGVGQAADQWARARMATADPFANLIWGDTVGGAQNSLLNERARQVQVAMAREQMAREQERQNRIERSTMAENETRRQIGQQNFLARIAESLADAQGDNADAYANAEQLRQLSIQDQSLRTRQDETQSRFDALRRMLGQNAQAAVAGNRDLDVRIGADGLPTVYSPTRNADANQIRDVEARIYGRVAPGAFGPSQYPTDPQDEFDQLSTRLNDYDSRRRLLDRDLGSAMREPTGMVDTSLLEQLLAGSPRRSATVGQSAAQLLQDALTRGAAYRLPQGTMPARDLGPIRRSTYRRGDPPTPGLRAEVESPRWTFDPETLRFV